MRLHSRRAVLKLSGAALGGIAVGTTVTVAARTDRYVVRTNRAGDFGGLEVVHALPGIEFGVVRGTEDEVKQESAVGEYAPDFDVRLDEPDVNARAPTAEEASATDEPLYDRQWDKQALDLPTAHETTEGEGTRVTIIDTGVAAGHPDLDVDEARSRNFTDDDYGSGVPAGGYHGTHVAGITAALTDNQEGIAGTAPATDLVDCRVFSPGALASFGDILAALVYSANVGADAANLSLGAYPVSRKGLGSFYGKVLNSTTSYARRQGTIIVVAAGNDSADLQHDGRICADFDDDGTEECRPVISLPNEAANVMSISATGPIGFMWGDESLEAGPESPAFYTNYGTNAIDLAAPGGDADLDAIGTGVPWYHDLVLSTVAEPQFSEDGEYLGASYGYDWAAGTSMAAPQVAGAAALVRSANPDYNARQVGQALERAADVPDGYDKTYYGSGFLNVVDAL